MCVSSKLISPSDSILPLLLWVNIVCLPMAEMNKNNKAVNKHFVQLWPRDGLKGAVCLRQATELVDWLLLRVLAPRQAGLVRIRGQDTHDRV